MATANMPGQPGPPHPQPPAANPAPPPPQAQQQQQFQGARQQHQGSAIPLYDLFLDLPHPAASSSCPPPFILGAPSNTPEMEKELSSNVSRVARFAFPEFDDAVASRIPRESALNRFSQYAMQPKTFQHYTFSLQLQSGVRIHGHVRRYLPAHNIAKFRYDVGRRGERALVLLTRSSGGDLVYSAILKTMDAIEFQKVALDKKRQPHEEPEKWFLHKLFEEHRKLCTDFAAMPLQERKPMLLNVVRLEAGDYPIPLLEQADTSKFLLPTSLMSPTSAVVESVSSSSILPLLRVLGVQNTLRLLSALLSESRVLLISASPTRLAQCARSALSILAQGLLNWQHLYIPVLPPHLFQYLAAPVPYLIGMLNTLAPRLDQAKAEGLGEMVIINLDTIQMETRGINPADVAQRIPDLFRTAMAEQGLPAASMSASEMLAQDLVDLLKVDKRTLYGESALTNVSETAAKATKAVKSGLTKAFKKGKQFLKNRSSSMSDGSGDDEEEDDRGSEEQFMPDRDSLLPDYIYTQGAQNETAEEEARIAFTSFFLSLFGNMRWYLSASPGKLPQLDRKRFLQQKRSMGEGENTPVWPLLQNFCQTQMLEEFAKARVEEVRTRHPVTSDSPLFSQCANHHRLHGVDFSVVNVRRIARLVAQNSPSRSILQTTARRTAMLLTSNRTFEGDYNKAVAHLVEQCRESSSVLFDVMSVIWVRLRDSKGLHWKHGLQALQILRNLLYHGPLAAIAEATDGLDKIRMMKFYNDNMRSQICTQIRQVAANVYSLLVDRVKLFTMRRLCINKRRMLRQSVQGRHTKDQRVRLYSPFTKVHAAFNPSSRAQVGQADPKGAVAAQFAADQDLLGFNMNPSQEPTPAPSAAVMEDNPFNFAITDAPGQSSEASAPAAVNDNPFAFAATPASEPSPSQQNPPPKTQQKDVANDFAGMTLSGPPEAGKPNSGNPGSAQPRLLQKQTDTIQPTSGSQATRTPAHGQLQTGGPTQPQPFQHQFNAAPVPPQAPSSQGNPLSGQPVQMPTSHQYQQHTGPPQPKTTAVPGGGHTPNSGYPQAPPPAGQIPGQAQARAVHAQIQPQIPGYPQAPPPGQQPGHAPPGQAQPHFQQNQPLGAYPPPQATGQHYPPQAPAGQQQQYQGQGYGGVPPKTQAQGYHPHYPNHQAHPQHMPQQPPSSGGPNHQAHPQHRPQPPNSGGQLVPAVPPQYSQQQQQYYNPQQYQHQQMIQQQHNPQPPQQPKKNMSQFDPLTRDPFA